MTIDVMARGVVSSQPEDVAADDGPVVAFMLGTRQLVRILGQTQALDDVPAIEVVCAGALAARARVIDQGETVTVAGQLLIRVDAAALAEGPVHGLIEIHATSVTVL